MADTSPDTIAGLRARLRALADAHAAGAVDAASYETARRDVERALAELVLATPDAADAVAAPPPAVTPRPSKRLVGAVCGAVVVVALAGYAWTGSPSLAGLGAPPPPQPPATTAAAPPAGGERAAGLQQIAEMVDKLATRLKDRPDDAEGWTMLARSYMVLERYGDALPAYAHALALRPQDAALLADSADAMAASSGGRFDAKARALLDRALTIEPGQPKALALVGTIAFDAGDYGTAVKQWQKIADQLPPDSEFHRQVTANIDEARRRGGLPIPPSVAATRVPPAAASTAATGPSPAPAPEALSGTVTLAPSLAARAAPDDTVFVLARAEGGRMPLAVFRAKVRDLPLHFRLDDSMAMTPTMKISDLKQVIVAARVSKSGNAISQPGDLAGESGPVAPGTAGLSIVVANVVPER